MFFSFSCGLTTFDASFLASVVASPFDAIFFSFSYGLITGFGGPIQDITTSVRRAAVQNVFAPTNEL
jgi:hypothetical protein